MAELKKSELVERLGKHLNKLSREDLASIAERVEAKTLDLSSLTLSGEGGFGFQEEAQKSSGSADHSAGRHDSGGGDSGEGESLLERGADQGRALLEKAKSAVTG